MKYVLVIALSMVITKVAQSQTADTTKKESKPIVCKLTSTDLQNRKKTVIANLKTLVLERKELENGYSYRFEANDSTLDFLMEFIKSERQCCDFFDFAIQVKEDNVVWLEITGPSGTKSFITSELDF
jgi:hypothetical protein